MSTIYILKGLPGCGKTTEAKKMLQQEKKILRVNKDELRMMAQFGGYQSVSEKVIVQAEYDLVDLWTSRGFSVIVDDTNLNSIHEENYRKIAEKYPWCKVEVKEFNTPVDRCVLNDLSRKNSGGHYVGKDNIINMGFRFGYLKQEKPCIVFDMDGTLSDPAHRRTFVRKEDAQNNDSAFKPDWVKFFETCDKDAPRDEVIAKAREAKGQGYEVIICSARPEDYRDKTEKWLEQYNVPYDRLIMRKHADYRKDTIVKKEFLDQYLDKTKIVRVYDDRPCVIQMWRDNGLQVEDVGNGIEF